MYIRNIFCKSFSPKIIIVSFLSLKITVYFLYTIIYRLYFSIFISSLYSIVWIRFYGNQMQNRRITQFSSEIMSVTCIPTEVAVF